MDELITVTAITEPITAMLSTFQGRLVIRRLTVTKAIRPPRIGAVETLLGLGEPASAAINWSLPKAEISEEVAVSTTTVTSMATRASKSWRRRLRKMSATAAAIGRPRVPMPPMTLSTRTSGPGRFCTPEAMSESRPAVVLVAK